MAKQIGIGWIPEDVDSFDEVLENMGNDWPLWCHTRSGKPLGFENKSSFERWISRLLEVRNGAGDLVRREPPSGMTHEELAKLIGMAVARGAVVEPLVPDPRTLDQLACEVVDTLAKAPPFSSSLGGVVLRAQADPGMADRILGQVYGNDPYAGASVWARKHLYGDEQQIRLAERHAKEAASAAFEEARSQAYRPFTTDEKGVTFHKPAVDWAAVGTSTPTALVFASLFVLQELAGMNTWWLPAFVALSYVAMWTMCTNELRRRAGED